MAEGEKEQSSWRNDEVEYRTKTVGKKISLVELYRMKSEKCLICIAKPGPIGTSSPSRLKKQGGCMTYLVCPS